MNSRARKVIRILSVCFWILALFGVGLFIWNAVSLDRLPDAEILTEPSQQGSDDPFALVVVGIFSLVFLALFIEFLGREVFRRHQRRQMGRVLVSIGRAQSPLRFVSVLVALVFVIGFNLIIFRAPELGVTPDEIPLSAEMAFWLFYGIGHFLFLAFLLRAIRNRPFFLLTDKGFLYEPGDVSPGLISWTDVSEVREVELVGRQASFGGANLIKALAVRLKNPEAYRARYTLPLRLLVSLLTRFVRFQTAGPGEAEGPGDLVMFAQDFGSRYNEVKLLMMDRLNLR